MLQNYLKVFNDIRLQAVVGDHDTACAVQFWVLELKQEENIETRFLYGRALPGTFQSHKIDGSLDKRYEKLVENISARVLMFNLNTSASRLRSLLQSILQQRKSFLDGCQISKIELSTKAKKILQSFVVGKDFIIRPVMHLPTRDYYRFQSKRLSPSAQVSFDSASISRLDKECLLQIGTINSTELANLVCEELRTDTGLEFSEMDAWRLGDFELLCSPGLTANEQKKYDITTKGETAKLDIYEPLTTYQSDLLIIIKAYSEQSVQSTHMSRIDKTQKFPITLEFDIDEFKKKCFTAYSLEIYSQLSETAQSFICVQCGHYYVRSAYINITIVSNIGSGNVSDWLAKQVPKSENQRLNSLNSISRLTASTESKAGGSNNDKWVDINRKIQSQLSKLLPQRSSSRFFPKLSDNNGLARLELVEWLKKLFAKYQNAQIAWFDPYMEDVGIELLNRLGSQNGDYIIVTSANQKDQINKLDVLESHIEWCERFGDLVFKIKNSLPEDDQLNSVMNPIFKETGKWTGQFNNIELRVNDTSKLKKNRLQYLLDKCQEWDTNFGSVRLRVLALPDNKLHDRMVLVRSKNNEPLVGYHLSNSIQKANENYPFLITIIPDDLLPSIFEYTDDIIQSALYSDQQDNKAEILFDSTTITKKSIDEEIQHVSPFELSSCGDVLSWWLDKPELQGLKGENLRQALAIESSKDRDFFHQEVFEEIPDKFWSEAFFINNFNSAWDAMGYILAHSKSGDSLFYTNKLSNLPKFSKEFLLAYIDSSRKADIPCLKRKSLLDVEYYLQQSLEDLLLSSHRLSEFEQYESSEVLWGDYYAIKILWAKSHESLVRWFDEETQNFKNQNIRQTLLLARFLRTMGRDLAYSKNLDRINSLLKSKTHLLKWFGINALSDGLNQGYYGVDSLSCIDFFKDEEIKIKIILWLINEANFANALIKNEIIEKSLIDIFPRSLKSEDIKNFLVFVRGRLKKLYHFKPWVLESILLPLLESKKINIDQIADIWETELEYFWDLANKGECVSFNKNEEGYFTDEFAIIFCYLSTGRKLQTIKKIRKIFNNSARVIRKPLSSDASFRLYINAHEVNLWIGSLVKRLSCFTEEKEVKEDLDRLLDDCNNLIDRLGKSACNITINELMKYYFDDVEKLKYHPIINKICLALIPTP